MVVLFTEKLPSEQPDGPREIFYEARAFRLAGDRAQESIEIEPGVYQSLTAPAIVNWCLAIELGLKALVANTGSELPREHHLGRLLALIPEADRVAIEHAYAQRVMQPPLTELLSEAGAYFVQVRYDYEAPERNYHTFELEVLAGVVIEHCSKIEWIDGPLKFRESPKPA